MCEQLARVAGEQAEHLELVWREVDVPSRTIVTECFSRSTTKVADLEHGSTGGSTRRSTARSRASSSPIANGLVT